MIVKMSAETERYERPYFVQLRTRSAPCLEYRPGPTFPPSPPATFTTCNPRALIMFGCAEITSEKRMRILAATAIVAFGLTATSTEATVIKLKGRSTNPDHRASRQHQSPKRVDSWNALPRSTVGKVLRREVRKKYWSDPGRRSDGSLGWSGPTSSLRERGLGNMNQRAVLTTRARTFYEFAAKTMIE